MDYQSDPNYEKQRNVGAELLATALLNDNGSGKMTGVAGELQTKIRAMDMLLSEFVQTKPLQTLQHCKEIIEENEKLREKVKKLVELLKEWDAYDIHQNFCAATGGSTKCTCRTGKIREAVNNQWMIP
jgi:hypothetical protein